MNSKRLDKRYVKNEYDRGGIYWKSEINSEELKGIGE